MDGTAGAFDVGRDRERTRLPTRREKMISWLTDWFYGWDSASDYGRA